MTIAVGFIPELQLDPTILRKTKLLEGLWILPETNKTVIGFRKDLKTKGFVIAGGGYLLFEGELKDDGTLYEIFLGYSLSLIFFNPRGRTTCRAIKNLDTEELQLFIDSQEKFRFELTDTILLERTKIKYIKSIYFRVETQLTSQKYNPLRNSLEFFTIYLNEKLIRTRLLYMMICLESILVGSSETEGVTYKLSIRCANLLSAFYNKADKENIFEELKNSYGLRSRIIHGGDYIKESTRLINKRARRATELDHVYLLEPIVKDVLSLIFSKQDLYDLTLKDNLGKAIDEQYLLS